MTSQPYKALLIDLDGVVRRWPSSYEQLERASGLPVKSILGTAFEEKLLYSVVVGEISDEVWRSEIASSLKERHPNADVETAIRAWTAPVGEINSPVLELVVRARKKLKTILVTNATSKLRSDLSQLNLTQHFDAIINSSEVRSAKPSKEIFIAALAAAKISEQQALFVDDSALNVKAAKGLGITSHHFIDSEGLASFLEESGVV